MDAEESSNTNSHIINPSSPPVSPCQEIKPICGSSLQEDLQPQDSVKDTMLDHLANNKLAHFKSQQIGDPELSFEQKRQIAEDILKHNPGQFLSRFGQYLQSQDLNYFAELDIKSENYEVSFYLKRLRRYHCKMTKEVDVKNRRFEALKKLIKEGSYFSEKEMKQRNPLLYQQLVGQYLTRREVEDQETAERGDVNSWVSILLAQIERDQMICLRKRQKCDEECAIEEMDTSDEEEEDDNDDDGDDSTHDSDYDRESERESDGKLSDDDNEDDEKKKDNSLDISNGTKKRKLLHGKERTLLKEEFVTNMYQSFLDGKDEDFDYSQVDLNPDYDCLAVRTQDEEEKYFDSETPELVADEHMSAEEDDDELDTYMKNLKPESTPSELAGNFKILL